MLSKIVMKFTAGKIDRTQNILFRERFVRVNWIHDCFERYRIGFQKKESIWTVHEQMIHERFQSVVANVMEFTTREIEQTQNILVRERFVRMN